MSVSDCVSPEGTRSSMVRDLCLVHHWIPVSQSTRHISSTQLTFAAHPGLFSVSALLGKSTCLLYTSSS